LCNRLNGKERLHILLVGNNLRRFRGEAENKVDNKGRVSIPAAFRRILEEGDPDWSSGLNPNLLLKQIKKLRQQLLEIKEVILKERWHMQCIFQDLM